MEKLKIKDILKVTNGKLINGDENQEIESFSKDTRNINKGDLYIGIKGEKFDGNLYYKEAFKKGAIACLLDLKEIEEEDVKKYKNIILVEDTIEAIQKLAAFWRNTKNIPIIAVTGSVGKTSTKDMVASVLAKKYSVLKTEGNNNNHIGLPLTLLKLKEQEVAVVEMGMNHFGEISLLSKIAKPTACIITNIGTSHIGNLGSRENILKAKLEILEGLKENGYVLINNDNDLLNKWAKENKGKYNIKTYGFENKSDYMAYDINLNESGSKFNIKYNEIEKKVKVPVPGVPFVYNALCGIALGQMLDMNVEDILDGILSLDLTKKRMEILVSKSGVKIINDAYNASLDSVKPALEQLKIIYGNKKIAVLGDMLELGSYEKELHEKVGEAVVENKIDVLITVGEAAKNISKKAKELHMGEIYSYSKNEEAIKKIKELVKKDDVVLIKASNSMKFSEITNELVEL